MKDTIITGNRKIIEIITFIVCFIIACIINVYAIIQYNTPWSEIFTSIGYVFLFAVALYVAWSVIRLVFYYLRKMFKTKRRR